MHSSDSSPSAAEIASAAGRVKAMLEGFEKTQIIYVAVRLGVPDTLAAGPLDVAGLAERVDVAAPALYRALRAMAWCGLVEQRDDGRFALTPLGGLLRSGVEGSLHHRAVLVGELEYPAWAGLLDALRGGGVAFERIFGRSFYDHLSKTPEVAAAFDGSMTGASEATAGAVARACDLSDAAVVVDVGGSEGILIEALLRANPHLQGVVFDLPPVVARARQRLEGADIAHRLRVVGGDFMAEVPEGGDVYALKWILHNWSDDDCVRILQSCRRAMGGRGRLLVIERILPDRADVGGELVSLDLCMMVCFGTRERTEGDYRALLGRGGFEVTAIASTPLGPHVIEAIPAETRPV